MGEQEMRVQIMRLKQLVRDMQGCLWWQYEPHSYMMDGCDSCTRRPKSKKCGKVAFAERMRELGVEATE